MIFGDVVGVCGSVQGWAPLLCSRAPANYAIDKVDLDVGSNNQVDSQISKPTAGWPVGTYKVDLAIDGALTDSVPFSIP